MSHRLLLVTACLTAAFLHAQEFSASLSITVADPSNARVPAAQVVLVAAKWGTARKAETNHAGSVTFDSLEPGDYSLEITKAGFDKVRVERVPVAVRSRLSFHFELKVSTAESSITVTSGVEGLSTDASHSTSVDQNYVQNLPVNGRSVETLVAMAPGITSAAGGRGGLGGGFNANGLRSNTNYYTLDGLSVNTPLGGGPMIGGGGRGGVVIAGGGSDPAGTSAISIDSLQEVRVQTSPFAPEFGRTPGAQVSMTSRGGTNEFHGLAYYYLRNDVLNANDWFANSRALPRGEMRQSRPGGTFGGPLLKNRTFFFFSYDAQRLELPNTIVTSVPHEGSRRAASATLRPYLNAFPVSNGASLGNGAAEFTAVVANPSSSDSGSVRIDHGLGSKATLFTRYSWSPSSGETRGSELVSPNTLTTRNSRSDAFTTGLTIASSASLLDDLRVNYSASDTSSRSVMDNFGGAVPITADGVFPAGIAMENGEFTLMALGVGGYSVGGRSHDEQNQLNVVYSRVKTLPSHSLKIGLDYRRTMMTNYRTPYNQTVTFNGLGGDNGSLFSGVATNAQISSNLDAVYPVYLNFSGYAQDTWRATRWTTITYGLRWDVNPAPGVRQGPRPFALSNDAEEGVTQVDPLYFTRWKDIAPRFGLAYNMDERPGQEMMLRLGVGAFYDVGYGISAGAFNGAPYTSVRTISLATFPLSSADTAAPTLPPTEPYGQITAADKNLKSPLVWQWNLTWERAFGRGQVLSIGYAGTRGSRLMRTESQPSFSEVYDVLRKTTNGAESRYDGLQIQFRRRMSANWQTQLSYTYGHSIDTASNDAGFSGGFATLFGGGERGSSDFDIRHNLNWSGSYRLPGGWYADWVATTRTGLPFDVIGVSNTTSDQPTSGTLNRRAGLFAQVRPDYNGEPVWIDDKSVPGGRRVNPDAFETPDGFGQGNLGRNALRGFGAAQIDLALRRQVAVGERWRLNISAQAFNVLNHAAFANPSRNEGANLSSPNFGIANRTLSQGPGGSSLYRSGGPRSVEISLRLQF